MNVRYEKQYGAIASRHDELKEEFREFLIKPKTKNEIMARFNLTDEQFRTLITQVSTHWPIWEDYGSPHTYGWLR